MPKYILLINYINDPDTTIHIFNDQILRERIAALKQMASVTQIHVYTLTSEHTLKPSWIETPCAQ